jgi:hypothetical protein
LRIQRKINLLAIFFLVATAMEYKLKVITQEKKDSEKKMPCNCKINNIECHNLVEFAKLNNWKY